MTTRGYGIPYQGSKGKFAARIYRAIAHRHPDARTLIDPFCGGWAVSHAFTIAGWDVHASDVDPYVVALLRHVLSGHGLGEWATRWVERDLFEECVKRPELTGLDAWEVGLVRVAWSFGIDQRTYLYGQHVTARRAATHEKVMSRRGVAAQRAALSREPRHDRLQHAESLWRVASLVGGGEPPMVADYRDALTAHASTGTVVYLDPPYANTKPYPGAPMFDSATMWAHAERAAHAGAHVYVSEYKAPPGWRPILTFTRPNILAADPRAKATSRATERLYAPDRPRHGHQP